MNKITTILFDWDGTLAETLEVWLQTFKESYASVGLNLEDKQIGSQFGNWSAHIELGVKPEDEDVYKQHLEVAYERLDAVQLYDGALAVLTALKEQGYKIGLVSTSNRRMINAALANNRLENIFDLTLAAEDTVKHKPDPEPLFTAIARLGSTVSETIFVGDSDKDTGSATNAGMELFLFVPESHNIYYDLEKLKQEYSVASAFTDWRDFPFERLN